MDLVKRNRKSVIRQTIPEIQHVKNIMYLAQLMRQLESVCDKTNYVKNYKWPYVMRVLFDAFSKPNHILPKGYFQHKPVSDLEFERLTSSVKNRKNRSTFISETITNFPRIGHIVQYSSFLMQLKSLYLDLHPEYLNCIKNLMIVNKRKTIYKNKC